MGVYLSLLRHGFDQGFNIPTPVLTEKNLPDQSGKVFIITGANIGVGYEVASILYSRNAKVYLACRTQSKAEDAISSIKSAHPSSNGSLHFLKLDLSDLATIKASAEEFISKEKTLHWLDNNAGVMVPPRGSKGAQGHELQLSTNVLGPYLFTKLLLPVLQDTAKHEARGTVRVSWAGSLAVDAFSPRGGIAFKSDRSSSSSTASSPLQVDDLGGLGPAYGTSKCANWFLAHEFGRRGLDSHGDGVLHNAYNPGNLNSNLAQHVRAWTIGSIVGFCLDRVVCYPARFGAYTEIYAGLSQDLSLDRTATTTNTTDDQGAYIIPWGRRSVWNRPDVAAELGEGKNSEKLWEWCEQETKAFA